MEKLPKDLLISTFNLLKFLVDPTTKVVFQIQFHFEEEELFLQWKVYPKIIFVVQGI